MGDLELGEKVVDFREGEDEGLIEGNLEEGARLLVWYAEGVQVGNLEEGLIVGVLNADGAKDGDLEVI